jgi:4-amino-4-deoxy-L-arabinose transferase-like glycosyltransferase
MLEFNFFKLVNAAPPSCKIPPGRARWGLLSVVISGFIVAILYLMHLMYCQFSAMRFFDLAYTNSDMHANLLWAQGIREQGWLNPSPFHPYNYWMQPMAPYSQWVQWWGGGQIFQQSPLYAYLLALLLPKLILMRLLQAVMSMGTCAFLGLLTARITGRLAGWIAFWLAALYAPFYAYSWPFLRDGLGWFITAALLWALTELTHSDWSSRRARQLGWTVGALLGLGFLTKETYLLLIPTVLVALVFFARKRRTKTVVVRSGIAVLLAVSPLLIRNYCVHAPLLSTSNRFAETFIHGNAGTSHPYLFVIPTETGRILRDTHEQMLPVIRETIASHQNGWAGWIRLQCFKFLSLFDPYESPDNLSIYFVAHISPMVRFGLRYWMILVPALAGLVLSLRQQNSAHLWLWILLPIFLASLFVGVPMSRYRQSLMIFLIPWAACFFAFIFDSIRRHDVRRVVYCVLILLFGWVLVLGPLARQPRNGYERPAEYLLTAYIYHQLGDEKHLTEMRSLIREKFPNLRP